MLKFEHFWKCTVHLKCNPGQWAPPFWISKYATDRPNASQFTVAVYQWQCWHSLCHYSLSLWHWCCHCQRISDRDADMTLCHPNMSQFTVAVTVMSSLAVYIDSDTDMTLCHPNMSQFTVAVSVMSSLSVYIDSDTDMTLCHPNMSQFTVAVSVMLSLSVYQWQWRWYDIVSPKHVTVYGRCVSHVIIDSLSVTVLTCHCSVMECLCTPWFVQSSCLCCWLCVYIINNVCYCLNLLLHVDMPLLYRCCWSRHWNCPVVTLSWTCV